MKKLIKVLLVALLVLVCFNKTVFISADDDAISDCSGYEDEDEYNACLINKASEMNNNINDIRNEIAEAQNNFEAAQKLASQYALEAEALEAEIEELNVKIDELQVRIDELEARIEENEAKVEELNKRVLGRMEESQKTMHFNPYLKFILGSNGFSDMLRRVYGVEAIVSKEKADREELVEIINALQADKAELDKDKAELDTNKEDLVAKQGEYLVMYEYYLEVQRETEEEVEYYQNMLESMKQSYSDILQAVGSNIAGLPSSAGFLSAVPGSGISSYFPYYPASFGGGIHLGIDYAGVSRGQAIVAPANGVILVSYQGCADPGYLGCSCGGDGYGNGVSYGGNQVYLMCEVDGTVYAFTFSHLNAVAVSRGDVVLAGDTVGYIGSSGNSTGVHCHIEMFLLGRGTLQEYMQKNYSTSFNCGWGSTGLANICEYTGYSTPCRLNPANYLG